jgi:hypothetical protein
MTPRKRNAAARDEPRDFSGDVVRLASNLVDDFSDTDNDAPEMPRDMQVQTVAASISDLVEDAREEGRREILRAILTMEHPIYTYGEGDRTDSACSFCDAPDWLSGTKHAPDCLWLRNQNVENKQG